jgi:hypothetical protein
MVSIYDSNKVRLPSVVTTEWKKHKLWSFLNTHGKKYSDFIDDVIYEIMISQGTGTPKLLSWHRDVHEATG